MLFFSRLIYRMVQKMAQTLEGQSFETLLDMILLRHVVNNFVNV